MVIFGVMGSNENVKTIRFPVKTDERLQALANKCGLSKLGFFVSMVDYFYKTKKDPRDLNDELLKNAINRKTDNIIAFIRTQEQDLLVPVKKESEQALEILQVLPGYFKEHIIKHNNLQAEASVAQTTGIKLLSERLDRLDLLHNDRNLLKKKFSQILEHYIRQREQLSVLSKQADKEELVAFVRSQVAGL